MKQLLPVTLAVLAFIIGICGIAYILLGLGPGEEQSPASSVIRFSPSAVAGDTNQTIEQQLAAVIAENKRLKEELQQAANERDNLKQQLNHAQPARPGEYVPGVGFVPVQSEARPYGLDITGIVRDASSDARSRQFRDEMLPAILEYMQTGSQEAIRTSDLTISPEQLTLSHSNDMRVYFVGEAAGFQNSIGINMSGKGIESGNPQLVFPNASMGNPLYDSVAESPLQSGDFVDIGKVQSGAPLDLFIISNGVRNPKAPVFSADTSRNKDQADHMIVHGVVGNDTLLVGFEDLVGGGDQNFTDVVIAVQIGAENVATFLEQDQTKQ